MLVVQRNGSAVALAVSRDAGGRVVVIANPALDRLLLLGLAGLTLEAAPLAELAAQLATDPAAGPAAAVAGAGSRSTTPSPG